MQPQGLDLIDIIHKGAIATYPLILLSIISLTVVFERLWSLRNLGAITLRVTESILEPVKKGQRDLAIAICKQNSNWPVARIFLNILERESSARMPNRVAKVKHGTLILLALVHFHDSRLDGTRCHDDSLQ